MRIRFLSDQVYESAGPNKGPTFTKGEVLEPGDVTKKLGLAKEPTPEWIDGFMNRWLQRKVAVDHDAVPVETTDFSKMTRAQLDALAEERGVDVSGASTKADVIAALELAEETT
jgi:hypothetical protein